MKEEQTKPAEPQGGVDYWPVRETAGELLRILDVRYPAGANQLPGVTLFTAMEDLRSALSHHQPEEN